MPATDNFSQHNPGLDSPCDHAVVVTPHDTNEFTIASRAIYVGGAGNAVIVTVGNETVTFSGIPAGTILPIRAKRVNSTNTTATNMVAIY